MKTEDELCRVNGNKVCGGSSNSIRIRGGRVISAASSAPGQGMIGGNDSGTHQPFIVDMNRPQMIPSLKLIGSLQLPLVLVMKTLSTVSYTIHKYGRLCVCGGGCHRPTICIR